MAEHELKTRPILFKGAMVRAILDGTKTQTRRVIKSQPPEGSQIRGPEIYTPGVVDRNGELVPGKPIFGVYDLEGVWGECCPYGAPGDRLWVREAWNADWCDHVIYRADGGSARDAGYASEPKWKPSIHMPRWASRITLEVTGVRVERVQDISEADAKAEGTTRLIGIGDSQHLPGGDHRTQGTHPHTLAFGALWDGINADRGFPWASNPWVWVVEFKRVEAPNG